MVKLFVAVTDQSWFDFLSASAPHDEVNFWAPSGHHQFHAVGPGERVVERVISRGAFVSADDVLGLIRAIYNWGAGTGRTEHTAGFSVYMPIKGAWTSRNARHAETTYGPIRGQARARGHAQAGAGRPRTGTEGALDIESSINDAPCRRSPNQST